MTAHRSHCPPRHFFRANVTPSAKGRRQMSTRSSWCSFLFKARSATLANELFSGSYTVPRQRTCCERKQKAVAKRLSQHETCTHVVNAFFTQTYFSIFLILCNSRTPVTCPRVLRPLFIDGKVESRRSINNALKPRLSDAISCPTCVIRRPSRSAQPIGGRNKRTACLFRGPSAHSTRSPGKVFSSVLSCASLPFISEVPL